MNDNLDLLFTQGKITASEYAKRIQEKENKPTEAATGFKQFQKEYSDNLGKNPFEVKSSSETGLSLNPEELDTFSSRGVIPTFDKDYENDRAERQDISDKWANGAVKMLGKTATAVIGGVGMVGSLATNIVGQFGDLITQQDATKFHEIYDNDFYKALDEANKNMDEFLPNYVTKAEQDYNLLESLGTANFWSNDVLQGASFIAGAVLTEGLMGLAAEATALNTLTKNIKAIYEGSKLGNTIKLFNKSAAAQTSMEAATLARQITTGAGYESAIESLSFVEDAKKQFIEDFKYNNGGQEPDEQTIANAMNDIYSVANGVFGMNMVVTGLSQAKSLPGLFSPKLGKFIGTTSNPQKELLSEIIETSTLTNKQLVRAAKNLGKTVDEIKAMPNIAKNAIRTNVEKVARGIARGGEGALFEGGQEGLQKAISYGAMDYLNDRFNTDETEDVIKSGLEGLSKAFGNNAESWKEIFIGALLGSVGGPGGEGNSKWSGGIIEGFRDPSKSPELQGFLNLANKYATNGQGILNNYLKHYNLLMNTESKKNKALDNGDIYDYKSEDFKQVFNYLNFMAKTDRLNQIEDGYLKQIESMSKKEFQEAFGYSNLSEADFQKRKQELNKNIVEKINNVKDSRETAASIYRGGDSDILDGITYTIATNKNLDKREEVLADEISKSTMVFDPRTLVQISRDAAKLDLKSGWLSTYKNKLKGLKAAKSALEKRMLSGSVTKKESEIKELEDKVKNIEKEIKTLLKEEHAKRKSVKKAVDYDLNFEEFETKVNEQVDFLEKVNKHYETNPVDKAETNKKLKDLKSIAKSREQYIRDFNRLLTKEGREELGNQISNLKQHYLDEQIDKESYEYLESQSRTNPDKKVYKTQEELFKLKGLRLSGIEDSVVSNIKTESNPSLKSEISKKYDSDIRKKAEDIFNNNKLSNDEKIKQLEDLKDAYGQTAFASEDSLKMDFKKGLSEFINDINNLQAQLKVNKSKSSNVIDGINRLFRLFNLKEDTESIRGKIEKQLIDSTTQDNLRSNSYFELEEYPIEDNPGTLVDVKDENKNVIGNGEVKIRKGFKIGDKWYGLKLKTKLPKEKHTNFTNEEGNIEIITDLTLGYVMDPTRYQFRKEDGTYEEFNPNNVEHLKLLNSGFVNEVDGKPTTAGTEFINEYLKLKNAFQDLLSKFGENGLDKPVKFTETKNSEGEWIYYFQKTVFYSKETSEMLEELDSNFDNLKIEFLDGDTSKEAPVLVTRLKDKISFFYYNKDTKSLEPIVDTDGRLKEKFIENGKYKFGVFDLKQLNVIVPVRSKIGPNSTEIISALPLGVEFEPFNLKESEATTSIIDSLNTLLTKNKEGNVEKAGSISINLLSNNFNGKVGFRLANYSKGNKFNKNPFVTLLLDIGDNAKDLILGKQGDNEFVTTGNFKGHFLKLFFDADGNIKSMSYNTTPIFSKEYSNYKGSFTEIKTDEDLLEYTNKVLELSKIKGTDNMVVQVQKMNDVTLDKIKNPETIKSAKIRKINSSINLSPFAKKLPKSNLTSLKNFESNKEDFETVPQNQVTITENLVFENENKPTSVEQSVSKEDLGISDEEANKFGSSADYEASPFKNNNIDLDSVNESISERAENLNSILPSWIPVDDIKNIAKKISSNKGFTYGAFINNVMYLASKAPKGVEFHEAFHAVFRTMLTDLQINKAYEEASSRYGKPSKEDINKLRNINPTYFNLSEKELTNLYYEEKMADEFMDRMNSNKEPKTFIDKILNKIKKFVNWVLGVNSRTFLDTLFNDIETGKFKTAKKINNIFTNVDQQVYKILQYTHTMADGSKRIISLTPVQSNNVLNRIFKEAYEIESENGYITNLEIEDLIKDLKSNFYNWDNVFSKIYEGSDKKEIAERTIKFIKASLTEKENIDYIVEQVRNMLDTYSIVNYDLEQDETESTTEFGIKSNDEVGGVDSLSKEMKKYLFTIPTSSDDLGLGVETTEFTSYADPVQLYNSLMRMMSDIKPSDMLSNLLMLSNDNKSVKSFVNKFFIDIADELNVKIEGSQREFNKLLSNLTIDELDKSMLFRMFVSNFRNTHVNQIQMLYDANNLKYRIFRSNVNDVQDLQVNSWARNFRSLGYDINPSKFQTAINNVEATFKKDLPFTFDNFNYRLSEIKKNLVQAGIEVSDLYLKISVIKSFKDASDKLHELSVDNSDLTDEYSNYLSLAERYSEYTFIDSDIASIAYNNNPYAKIEKEEAGASSSTSDNDSMSRLKKIANTNSIFDENVIPTTFSNSEGKKIFSYIKPNYITDIINILKNSGSKPDWLLDSISDEEAFKSFKQFLKESGLETNEYLEKKYFNAIRYNPILNLNSWDVVKSGLEVYINDGLRSVEFNDDYSENTYKDSEAKTFSSLSAKGKLIQLMSYFLDSQYNNISKKIKDSADSKTDFYPVIAFQNEGKSTQYAFMLPKFEAVSDNGELSETSLQSYNLLFKAEFERIKEVLKEIESGDYLIEDYHSKNDGLKEAIKNKNVDGIVQYIKKSKDARGLKLTNFSLLMEDAQFIKELFENALNNEEFNSEVLNKKFNEMVKTQVNEFLEYASSPQVNLIVKSINDSTGEVSYVNKYLPVSEGGTDYFGKINSELNIKKLTNFLVNDSINSASVINMLVGDISQNFKDTLDLPKRMAGLNSAGPSLGNTHTTTATIKDLKYDNEPEISGTKITDAQSHGTVDWYINKFLKNSKKWNPEIKRIYDKIRLCIDITGEERNYLEKYGALANSRKTSMFFYGKYGKMSTSVLTRNAVSMIKPGKFEEAESLIKKLDSLTFGTSKYNSVIKELQSCYQALPQTEYLHNLLNRMENSGTDIVMYQSAVKTGIYNVQKDGNSDFENDIIPDMFVREQVNTDNMKTKVIDGTQKLQLIDSEHVNPNLELQIFNKPVKISDVTSVYQNMLSKRIIDTYEDLKKSYLENDKPRYKALLKSFKESLLEQGGDPVLLDLFSAAENNLDESKFDLNLPKTLYMFEKMFYSYLSKPLSHKVAGHKFTLVSDTAYKVARDSQGNIVTMNDYKENPEKYNNLSTERLKVRIDPDNKNVYYAEAVIPRQFADMFNLKPGEYLNSKFAKLLGIRIPTQDKSSMAYIKIVDILPAEQGNTIILPAEVQQYSGADFDIDSMFAQIFASYFKQGFNDNKPVIFGEYLNKDSKESREDYAWEEYKNSLKDSKSIKADYDSYIKGNSNTALLIQENKNKLNKLDHLINRISKDVYLINFKGTSNKSLESILEDLDKGLISTKEFQNIPISKISKEKKAQLNQLLEAKKELKTLISSEEDKLFKAAVERNNYYYDKSKWLQSTKGSKTIEQHIESNFTAVSNGDIKNYIPLTLQETNNFLLELQIGLAHNVENDSIWRTSNERDSIDDFVKTLENLGKTFDISSKDYNTVTSKIKSSAAVRVGQMNIGIGALANTAAQHIIQAGVDVFGVGRVSSYKKGNGTRKNKSNQLMITTAVDNAKNLDEAKLNLTADSKGVVAIDIMLDNDNPQYTEEMSYIMCLTPLVEKLIFDLEGASDNIKNKEDNNKGSSKGAIKNNTGALITEYIENNGPFKKYTTYSYDEAKIFLKEIYSNNKEGISKEAYEFQISALAHFLNLSNVADYMFNFTQITSLIKGNKPTSGDNLRIYEYLNSLGIEIVKEGNNYTLQNTAEYKYFKENDPTKHPIDFLKVINNKPLLKTQLIIFHKLMEDSSNFLLHASKDGKEIIKQVRKSLKPNFFNDESRIQKLLNYIVATYSIRGMHKEKPSLKDNIWLLLRPTDVDSNVVSAFKKISSYEQFKNNKFLKAIDVKKITYKNESSPLNGATQSHLITNSRTRLSPEETKIIVDSLMEIYTTAISSENSQIKKDAFTFIGSMINQIYMKDAGIYVNESLLNLIDSMFMTTPSNQLKKVREFVNKENNNSNYESTLGMTKQEFIDEFEELFIRDINNNFFIKGNNLKYIIGNIRASIKATSSTFDSETISKMKELEKILEDLESNKSYIFTSDEFKKVSPIKISKDKESMEISMYPDKDLTIRNLEDYDDDVNDKKDSWNKLYKNALFSSGVVGSYFTTVNGKVRRYSTMPKYFKITIPTSKIITSFYDSNQNQNEVILYKRIDSSMKKPKGVNNSDVAYYAKYEKVSLIGSKQFLTPYFKPSEWDSNLKLLKSEIEKSKNPSEYKKEIVKEPVKKEELSKESVDLSSFFENLKLDGIDVNSIEEFVTFVGQNSTGWGIDDYLKMYTKTKAITEKIADYIKEKIKNC